jgi:predicted transcriptional regulator
MNSKTPQFDKAFNEVIAALEPHAQTCVLCGNSFRIEAGDIEFLKKLRVAPPRECPECRMRKRMAMEANLLQFYRKECAAHPGERVISQMDDDTPYKIYDNAYYRDPNAWDAASFGRPYDPSRPFESQLVELVRNVPHMAVSCYETKIINSDYTVGSAHLKNCYLAANIGESENISYGVWIMYSKDSIDLLQVDHADQSYEVIASNHIFNSKYIQDSENCMNSQFLFDCHNCQDCFGCVNLRNKRHCLWNEQLSPEEYRSKVGVIDLGSRAAVEVYRKKFDDFVRLKGILRAVRTKSSPNSTGDILVDSKNCYQTFAAISAKWILTFYKNRDVRYGQDLIGVENAMDVTMFGPGENSYNAIECLFANTAISSYYLKDCLEVEYSFECNDCRYCFGCSGLRKKKYCILNKQYGEEEYWRTVDAIKTDMLRRGTYGEFLPLKDSFFYYHDTYAQAMLPLDRGSAARFGARWNEHGKPVETSGLTVLAAAAVPDTIRDVTDDILNSAIVCCETGKPFRVIKSELEFYRRHGIPLPVVHPQARLLARFRRKNPYRLWESTCAKCGAAMRTSYPPERLGRAGDPARRLNVYCEDCYKKEVA